MIKEYLEIIKPGIIFGNLVSFTGGFLLASRGNINYFIFFISIFSVSLVIASSCIFNNVLDRDIDIKMKRTRNRVLLNKSTISIKKCLIYAILLGNLGFTLLFFLVNLLSMLLAIIGFLVYVGIYSVYMKRNSIYATLVGSISGAIPPVIGYCAVVNKFDIEALILFTIFMLWQMPHFYSIAILHFKDYQNAKIPILPIIKGIAVTKHHIIFYILAFIVANLILTLRGYTGYKYLMFTGIVNMIWLIIALTGYKTLDERHWARKLFILSIIVIIILSFMMSIDYNNIYL